MCHIERNGELWAVLQQDTEHAAAAWLQYRAWAAEGAVRHTLPRQEAAGACGENNTEIVLNNNAYILIYRWALVNMDYNKQTDLDLTH